jgi:hypothetical protein
MIPRRCTTGTTCSEKLRAHFVSIIQILYFDTREIFWLSSQNSKNLKAIPDWTCHIVHYAYVPWTFSLMWNKCDITHWRTELTIAVEIYFKLSKWLKLYSSGVLCREVLAFQKNLTPQSWGQLLKHSISNENTEVQYSTWPCRFKSNLVHSYSSRQNNNLSYISSPCAIIHLFQWL